MKIYMELVPRSRETLLEDVKKVAVHLKRVDAIVIPDRADFEISGLDGCEQVLPVFARVVPCFRALTIDPKKPLPMISGLLEKGFPEVIIVSGEPPPGFPRVARPSRVLEIIRKFKTEAPGLKVYSGFDPYRQGLQQEIEYARMKLDAGADGFFTQPFFDFNLLENCLRMLENDTVFWGLCPVLTIESRRYWEDQNNAVFQTDFQATLEWNRRWFKKSLPEIERHHGNACFMPIKAPILECFGDIL
jgi:methylenetetrahydrofolate reductase (NADPH)